jgi:aminopeptidase N
MAEQLEAVDPQRIHTARERCGCSSRRALRDEWARHSRPTCAGGYSPDPVSSGRRSLANLALGMLCLDATSRGDRRGRAAPTSASRTRPHDRPPGRAGALIGAYSPLAELALASFHEIFKNEPLVIDKWFTLQVTPPSSTAACSRARRR